MLYGSGARGEMRPDSDIDLLLVLATDDRHEVRRRATESVRGETCRKPRGASSNRLKTLMTDRSRRNRRR